jgi:hypothetical protein
VCHLVLSWLKMVSVCGWRLHQMRLYVLHAAKCCWSCNKSRVVLVSSHFAILYTLCTNKCRVVSLGPVCFHQHQTHTQPWYIVGERMDGAPSCTRRQTIKLHVCVSPLQLLHCRHRVHICSSCRAIYGPTCPSRFLPTPEHPTRKSGPHFCWRTKS